MCIAADISVTDNFGHKWSQSVSLLCAAVLLYVETKLCHSPGLLAEQRNGQQADVPNEFAAYRLLRSKDRSCSE
jgi:hypothetical protein